MKQEAILDSKLSLGALIGKTVNDAATSSEAAAAAAKHLSGVTVHADSADTVHLVVPAAVDMARLAAADESYFEELGRKALGACFYEILPE
ncbi:hypothetical protein [Pannonibacter phragmitetus]|uniref:hypothetical protein n=1 Tax=Pannonibacter phragmitetus TaxID=121719 RepID=UPI003D2EA003